MTLDEAIKHYKKKAEGYEQQIRDEVWEPDSLSEHNCIKNADEHRQLVEWLKELKQLREQEPCEDYISRQAAIDALSTSRGIIYPIRAIESLPSTQPEKRTEERTETHACDCISRQVVIDTIETDCSWDIFNEWGSRTPTGECIINAIKSVPSVEPERKPGKWINGKCNQCGKQAPFWAMSTTYYCSEYCPKCGAKMEEGKNDT